MTILKTNRYDTVPQKKIINGLMHDMIYVNDLNPLNPAHRKAVEMFWNADVLRIKDIESPTEYQFLQDIILNGTMPDPTRAHQIFCYLKPSQYTEETVRRFLYACLKNSINPKDNPGVQLVLSYDDKIVISVEYNTHKCEELYYFDNELQVPASLISKFKTTIRIEKPIAFLESLDTSVLQMGAATILNKINYILNASYRQALLEIVSKKDAGFYKLSNSYEDIEKSTMDIVNKKFPRECAVATSMILTSIEVDKGTKETIEDEFFELRKKRLTIDEELKYQRESLEIYTKKLEALAKYPAAKEQLTEAEKDKALDRYFRKLNPTNDKTKRVGKVLQDKNYEKIEDSIKLKDNIIINREKKVFKILRIVLAPAFFAIATAIAASTCYYFSGWLLCYGVSMLVYGLVSFLLLLLQKKKGTTIAQPQ